jgi:hypothetical protein
LQYVFLYRLPVGNESLDGEMCVGESHSEFVSLLDSSEHVLDVGGNGLNGTSLFSGGEPHYYKFNIHIFIYICKYY